ncbi:MAG: transposase [Oscillatoriaceae cyanobacterium Prado104]|jgi:putative transposase|nr:transposase [Oscillatoriaceae cyanobacterium Prado104]
MQYRRLKTPGATYFFTIVTHQRQRLFSDPEMVELLRAAFRNVIARFPLTIDAMVVLPDHFHCIWTLPDRDANFSTRWRLIKNHFTRNCPDKYKQTPPVSRLKKGEQSIWQRRFWEHQIKDELDFINHVDYIHYNPVKHGLVGAPRDWEYSSFHRYVRDGCYVSDWGANVRMEWDSDVGQE